MTNNKRVLAVVSLVFLSGCGLRRHETTETYVLVTANTKIPYWQEAVAGLSAAAHDYDVKSDVAGPDSYDPKAEKDEMMKVIAKKPAGILVSAADKDIMKDAIDAAVDAGIPVVTIDADSPSSKRLLFIGTNNYQAGQIGGGLVAKALNGRGTVVFYSIPGQANIAERLEGYKSALAREPGIKIDDVIDIKGESTAAFDATQNLLNSKKGALPDAFVCLEALACPEVADVLTRGKVTGKTIVAMDTSPATLDWIKKGVIRATIAQKPYTMAYYGLRVLDDLHHNRPTNGEGNRGSLPTFIDTGTTVVDSSNVASFQAAK
jgi:ribose transport system substrate-binding protein